MYNVYLYIQSYMARCIHEILRIAAVTYVCKYIQICSSCNGCDVSVLIDAKIMLKWRGIKSNAEILS